MAQLNEEVLEELVKLCRIKCNDNLSSKLLKNLNKILDYFDQIKQVNVEGVPPCNHILESMENVMREDEIGEGLETQTFLSNSPSHIGGMIRVPPVI